MISFSIVTARAAGVDKASITRRNAFAWNLRTGIAV
jgi:hypothetical protein